jgi:hypothetical protein
MPEVLPGFIGLKPLWSNRVTSVDWAIVRDAVTQSTQIMSEQFNAVLSSLVTDVATAQVRFEQPATGTLQPLDEYGRPRPASKKYFYDVAFPLEMGGSAWGASWVAREKMTVEEANAETEAAVRADIDWNLRRILGALFYNNTYNFDDEKNGTLAIQSLARGEVAVRYPKKDGTSVTSHQHFFAQANAISNTDNPFPTIKTAISEHPAQQAPVVVYCHSDQRPSIQALAAFTPILDADLVPGSGITRVEGTSIPANLADEIFGKVNGVWVGEWGRMPSGYLLGHIPGIPVVGRRQDPEASLRGFITKEIVGGPFPTFEFYRRAGYAILNRVAAVVYRIGNASYAPPSDFTALPLPN